MGRIPFVRSDGNSTENKKEKRDAAIEKIAGKKLNPPVGQ
jgi:hypothetical protein